MDRKRLLCLQHRSLVLVLLLVLLLVLVLVLVLLLLLLPGLNLAPFPIQDPNLQG